MKRRIFILIIIFVCIDSLSSREREPKNYQPVEEIYRTLSLPRRTWGLSLGMGLDLMDIRYINNFQDYFYYGGGLETLLSFTSFTVPFIPLGDRFELHFPYILPRIKFYPIKNVTIENGIFKADGPNLAFISEVLFNISGSDGFPVHFFFNLGYQFKTAINQWWWIYSSGNFSFDLELIWSGDLKLETGFQLSKHISLSLGGVISRANGIIYYGNNYIFSPIVYFQIPVEFKINFSQKRSLALITRINLFTDLYDWNIYNWDLSSSELTEIPIGLQYTRHW